MNYIMICAYLMTTILQSLTPNHKIKSDENRKIAFEILNIPQEKQQEFLSACFDLLEQKGLEEFLKLKNK